MNERPDLFASFINHATAAQTIAFAPDGATLFIAEKDAVWQHQLRIKHVPERLVCAVNEPLMIALHPQGSLIAIAENRLVRVCDVATGQERWRHHFGEFPQLSMLEVWDAAFSPDGTILATVAGKSLRLFATTDGREIWRREHTTDAVYRVAWIPDGALLATGDGTGIIRIWRAPQGAWPPTAHQAPLKISTPHGLGVWGLAFAPDGTMLASAGRGPVVLWDPHSGQAIRHLGDTHGDVTSIAISSLGKLIACADETALLLYDMATGTEHWRMAGKLHQVAFHPWGHVLGEVNANGGVTLSRMPRSWTEG